MVMYFINDKSENAMVILQYLKIIFTLVSVLGTRAAAVDYFCNRQIKYRLSILSIFVLINQVIGYICLPN